MPRKSKDLDRYYTIRAGKFRRYHGESFWSHLLDVKTNLLNLRDVFYFTAGFFQSLTLLSRVRPDVVFIKGGFVGVPIGFACRLRRIPYFTHDSDATPGLANRLIAGGAVYHAVGMPPEFYNYPKAKVRYTGIPLNKTYKSVSKEDKLRLRRRLKLPTDSLVITITGGSLGAARLNEWFADVAGSLLESFGNLRIIHQTGSQTSVYSALPAGLRDRIQEVAFTEKLADFTAAADLVIARAGATTIAELAVQAKACILVPNPQLTDGQQIKNAKFLAHQHAVVVVAEDQAARPAAFEQTISQLLRSARERQALAKNISALAKTDAADELADIIVEIVKNR